MYIKSTYDGLHVITGTTENVSMYLLKAKAVVCFSHQGAGSLCFKRSLLLPALRVLGEPVFVDLALLITGCCQFIN